MLVEFTMPASPDLPVVGAALTSTTLVLHRGWILERQRDLEIQDFFEASTLDGDLRARAEVIRMLLDGYKGRLGIHGPFWGFKIDSQDLLIRSDIAGWIERAVKPSIQARVLLSPHFARACSKSAPTELREASMGASQQWPVETAREHCLDVERDVEVTVTR